MLTESYEWVVFGDFSLVCSVMEAQMAQDYAVLCSWQHVAAWYAEYETLFKNQN